MEDNVRATLDESGLGIGNNSSVGRFVFAKKQFVSGMYRFIVTSCSLQPP
jgi:hypothetical protein